MKQRTIYGLFVLVCLIFGSTFLAISLGLKAGASPLFFAALRFTAAGIIMLAALLLSGRATLSSIRKLAGRSALLSLFLTSGTFGCMFIAQTHVDSGFMARLDASGPLLTALFASLILRKKFGLLHIPAFLLGTAGAFLIASHTTQGEPLYLLAALGSVVFYAAGNALYPLLFSPDEDTVTVSALQSLTGGAMLLAAALLTEEIRFPAEAFGPLLYLIIGGSIIAHTATLVLVREAGPVFASSWLYVAPAVATISGFIILNEEITAHGVAGMVLALAGVFLLDRAESRRAESSAAI